MGYKIASPESSGLRNTNDLFSRSIQENPLARFNHRNRGVLGHQVAGPRLRDPVIHQVGDQLVLTVRRELAHGVGGAETEPKKSAGREWAGAEGNPRFRRGAESPRLGYCMGAARAPG